MAKKQYFSLVLERGKKDTREYYHKDRRGWIYNVWSSILVAIITPIVYCRMGLVMTSQFWLSVLAGLLSGGVFFVVWRLIVFVCYLWKAPANLYREEKRKADRSNWNDVGFSYKEIRDGKNIVAHRLKVENNKADKYYFFVELQYLELDGKRNDYQEADKSRILSWVSGGDFNLQDGVALNPRGKDESKKVALWDMLKVVEEDQGKRYGIVYCEYDKSDRKKPPKKYAFFSRYAKGELRLEGRFIQYTIGTGACGSCRRYEEIIRGDFIYKFRIDIKDGNPEITVFEKGVFEIHSDSGEQETANE